MADRDKERDEIIKSLKESLAKLYLIQLTDREIDTLEHVVTVFQDQNEGTDEELPEELYERIRESLQNRLPTGAST
ncbi:MAG: hypothetical protein GTN97_03285 [Nitrosopumilaceae archaeon]|nr:hypothetical protein [Nitrosopumilaceae archaeon]